MWFDQDLKESRKIYSTLEIYSKYSIKNSVKNNFNKFIRYLNKKNYRS